MPVPGTMPVPDTVMIVLMVLPAGTVAGDRLMAPRAELLIEMDAALLFITAAGQGTCLAVLTTTEADIGQVAYEMAILVQRTGDHLQVNMRTKSALSDR